jgi:hypothetical protein
MAVARHPEYMIVAGRVISTIASISALNNTRGSKVSDEARRSFRKYTSASDRSTKAQNGRQKLELHIIFHCNFIGLLCVRTQVKLVCRAKGLP